MTALYPAVQDWRRWGDGPLNWLSRKRRRALKSLWVRAGSAFHAASNCRQSPRWRQSL